MKASMIDGLLTTAAGDYVCLVAFGVVSLSKDKKKSEEWRAKWGTFMKVAGPLLVAWGAFNILKDL